MPKNVDDIYEIAEGHTEVHDLGEKYNKKITTMHNEWEFDSPDVTVKGLDKNALLKRGITVVTYRDRERCLKLWKGISEEIKGLKCPF
jgi:hypothetical protein